MTERPLNGCQSKKSLDLLLVEDDPGDAALILESLSSSGFAIASRRVASEQALHDALQRSWDLVISDFRLPGFDGAKAFEICRKQAKGTPFLFVSGAGNDCQAVRRMTECRGGYHAKDELARLPAAVRRELLEQSEIAPRGLDAALWRRHRRLTIAMEATNAGLIEHHVPLDDSTFCSERLAEILGYTPDELAPRRKDAEWMSRQLHPDDSLVVHQRYEEFLTGARPRCELKMRVRHKRGQWVHVSTFFQALLRDEDGCARHVVGVMMDESARAAEEAHRVQSEKLEAIGSLAGGIAHDLNNLLTAIIGFSSFATEDMTPGDPTYEHLQAVLEAGDQARSLTAQLLAFSRRKPVSPQDVELPRALRNFRSSLEQSVGPQVELHVSIGEETWPARVDTAALRQVVLNLSANAREAMPTGGKLWVRAQNVSLAAPLAEPAGGSLEPGDYVVLELEDTGCGIPRELRDRVFEPFFSTKRQGEGAGLGLPACYGILTQAGGGLQVSSTAGKGSTFRAYLPRGGLRKPPEPAAASKAEPKACETVLVVDDNDIVRQTVSRTLHRLGYRVIEAEDGISALSAFNRSGARIDLILADVVMPGMDGIALANAVLEGAPRQPILYMSGYADLSAPTRCRLPATPENTIFKPFSPSELGERVRAQFGSATQTRRT